MTLERGRQAPDFLLYDEQARPVRLSDQRGHKVLLLFFPGAFSPVCTSELELVSRNLDRYREQDVRVFGVSTDSTLVLQAFKKANGLDITLLSDHHAEACARYGAKYDHDFTHMNLDRIAKRAAFLIDERGTVLHAEVLDDADHMPDLDAIDRVLEN